MSRFASFSCAALLLNSSACGDKTEDLPDNLVVEEQPHETYLVGIAAEDFKCVSVLDEEQSAAIFGGTVTRKESLFTPPEGVPRACNYVSQVPSQEPTQWSFDLDCREGALTDAGKLMASYASTPGATPLRIGQSALDHHESALLFIDDDTPCYGRVLGPDREKRKQLALHLTDALTPRSAPTGAHFQVRD